MVDWDMLHASVMGAFGEPARVQYTPAGGAPIPVDGIFDEAERPVRLVTDPEVNEISPLLGVQLSQFPPGFDARNAKGDTFVVRGVTYVVKKGKPDGHGWAQLEAYRK